MFFHDYPWTDFHEMNLTWIVKKVLELNTKLTEFVSLNTIKYADPIQWDITSQYGTNTVVVDPVSGVAYLSVKPVPMGVSLSNTDYWTEIFDLGQIIGNINKNLTVHNDGYSTTATFDLNEGDWVLWNGVLYIALHDIEIGDAYVPDANISQRSVEELIVSYVDGLKIMIDHVEDLVNSEVTARADADDVLRALIEAEVEDRQDADDALRVDLSDLITSKVSIEANARILADQELRQLIATSQSYYDTMADFISDSEAVADNYYVVNGYYNSGDCEIMLYYTTSSATGAFKEIVLDNGLCAHLVKKADNYYDVRQYGAYGDYVHNDYSVLNAVINDAKNYDNSIVYIPSGEYMINIYLSALRTNSITNDPQDFRGLTITGDGRNSIIHGHNDNDIFDVLQLNEATNINIKHLALTESSNAAVTWGANGISLTNGCYNIVIEDVTVYDLPYYVGDGFVNGGKAITIQTGNDNSIDLHDIHISDCKCYNVPYGFEFDAPANSRKYTNIVVKDCDFDVTFCGIELSMPSFGTNQYSVNTDFKFINNIIKSRQRCVNVSRVSNVLLRGNSLKQYGTKLTILPSLTTSNNTQIYAARCVRLEDNTLMSSFGDTAIHIQSDGTTISRLIVLAYNICLDSFSIAMIGCTGNNPFASYSNHNVGATTFLTANARNNCNLALDYGGYSMLSDYLMIGKTVAHTVGTGTGQCIPIYSPVGTLVGYVPIYN